MTSKIRTMYSAAAGIALSLTVVAVVPAAQENSQQYNYCNCDTGVELDSSLPLSHPQNRCATGSKQGVSWLSWLKGGNQSVQFHFLDLLELLSRQVEPTSEQRASS
ncbi:hypothetical protein KJY73_11800 [Bowmanella sp. Y26]|uniref:hypothetical protein n=1 Tax=Bowmanella yangjiangensis TaxID=2811230 RepID=UPI001BDD5F97|nr:hypothetical protein [Bowmanella yangjiangensis]MBT1064263.1 hypothetical protein [Bowmanella yangjiangensis]